MSSEDESEPVHKQAWFWPVMIAVFVVVFSGVAMALALRGTTPATYDPSLPPDIILVPRTQNQSTQFPSRRRSSGGPVTPATFHRKHAALLSDQRHEQDWYTAKFGNQYNPDV